MDLTSGGALVARLAVVFVLLADASDAAHNIAAQNLSVQAQTLIPDSVTGPTACAYPHFSDRRICGIHDSGLLNGWICDPDNTVSMSELYLIDSTLKRVYDRNDENCQCDGQTNKIDRQDKSCWYKFAFAFLRELGTPYASLPEAIFGVYSSSDCPNNTVATPWPQRNVAERTYDTFSAEAAFLYAQNYARLIRQRWDIGKCGEDVLFLVVQAPPDPLIAKQPLKRVAYRFLSPMVFVSSGDQVVERFGVGDTYTLPYALEPLRRIVDEANANLMNSYPLNKVLNNLVLKTVEALQKAENDVYRPRSKNHIPAWAWAVLGVCGAAFILMAISLCLIRTTTRRGMPHGKGGGNIDAANRRWKAGLVDDTQPTTYVNLVNLLMPHPRQQGVNVQQQQF